MSIEKLEQEYVQMLADFTSQVEEMESNPDIEVDQEILNQKTWIENVLIDIRKHK